MAKYRWPHAFGKSAHDPTFPLNCARLKFQGTFLRAFKHHIKDSVAHLALARMSEAAALKLGVKMKYCSCKTT